MTDAVDLLIRARFDAVANSRDDRDWNDVLARAHGREIPAERSARRAGLWRRVPARVALVAAVVALTAVVTAFAFGWPQRVVDFFSSAPAPTGVKNFMGSVNVDDPPGMNPHAIPGETKRITTVRFNLRGRRTRPFTLYVALTKSGGFCEDWTGVTAGCVSARTLQRPDRLGVGYGGDGALGSFVEGFVRIGATRTLQARFADGATAAIPVTWVSAPINAGFFLYPWPQSHQNRVDALRSVVALDADGRVVGRYTIPRPSPLDDTVLRTMPDGTKLSLPRSAEAAKARKIISFRATDGSKVTLWLIPLAGRGIRLPGGGNCSSLAVFNQGGVCVDSGADEHEPGGFGGSLSAGSSRVLFFGQATPDVATVELRYQNGEGERLTPIDGFVLHELGPAHWKPGTRLVAAVALNRRGKTLSTQRIDTQSHGLYPCKKPINRGYGVRSCP
jgi:hypothetical protein